MKTIPKDEALAAGGFARVDPCDAGADYALVYAAIELLSTSWQSQPDLGWLSAELGVSSAHCQKVFKRWCGVSPKDFVAALTVEHARRMLDESASILSAAHDSGLSGSSRLHDLFVSHHAMTPGNYKKKGAGLQLSYGFHNTPFGRGLFAASKAGLVGLLFVDRASGPNSKPSEDCARELLLARWPNADLVSNPDVTLPYAQQVFGAGRDGVSQQALRLVLIGSDFEIQVWEALLKIPCGRAVSYQDVARHIGNPKASRAVGAAVGRNPISFVVPCHRVLRSDGGLGGYHWGLTRKKAIIGWEAARYSPLPK